MRTRRSAVHRVVIANVSDNVGHAKSFAVITEASAHVHPKRLQPESWRGGGQSAPYERSSILWSRGRRQKTRSESSAGSANASGTQIIQGAVNLSHLASSRLGVGSVRGFGFVPMLRRVCATAVVHTECYATADYFNKTGINGQRVVGGGHFEVLRRSGLVVVWYMQGGGSGCSF